MKFFVLPLFLMAFIFTAISSRGQQEVSAKSKKIFTKAEDLYSHFDYFNAIEYYKQFLASEKGNQEAMLRIADSYYKIKDYDHTLSWYDSAVANGNLPSAHELQYANVLMNHGLKDKAISWLKKYIKSHPTDKRANEKLNGLEHIEQFFTNYRYYEVSNFAYNSMSADFSPTYYKQGLIFVSSRGDAKGTDVGNDAYLDFYFVDIADTVKKVPVKLRSMNNKFNEGPLAVFDNNKKMIFTRNDYVKKEGINGSSTVHFQMFYAENNDDTGWSKPELLSIHDKQYSLGHPAVTNNGKILYFASNIPGGYGGSDIYKSRWENNTWGKPVNLGSEINTEGDEMFPYILNDSILYFSSDGLRGLGGLDIFKYNLNHPVEIRNVGYPINSTKDDFGIACNKDASAGYFSSNREGGLGGDDIYKFTLLTELPNEEALAARVFKEEDLSSLPHANIKITSFVKPDLDLVADNEGIIEFYLPKGAPYIIIGSKDDYMGMYSNTVMDHEDKSVFVHPVPTNDGRRGQIPIIGRILNKKGELVSQASGTVTDKTTGEIVAAQFRDGLFDFFGHRGREYTIAASDNNYQPTSRVVSIPPSATRLEKITIVLGDKSSSSFTLATRVFKEADQTPLSEAHVSIISFTASDIELTANAEGIAEFNLPVGAPYVITGAKGDYIGMYANTVMKDDNKASVIYPVSTTNGHENQIPVIGRVINKKGELVVQADVIVTDKATGEKVSVQSNESLFHFFSTKGKDYTVAAGHKDYQSASLEVRVPSKTDKIERISIILDDKPSSTFTLAARAFKELDKSPLNEAHVSIISFTASDIELKANAEGIAEFNLPVGSPYVIIGAKDDYIGMYADVVMKDDNKASIIYPVATTNGHENQIPVVGRVINKKGELLTQSSVVVTDKSTGEKVAVQVKEGLFDFYGVKGRDYVIGAEDKDYLPASVHATVSSSAATADKISVTLEDKPAAVSVLATRMFKEVDKSPLKDAHISVVSFAQADLDLTANADGVAEFDLPVGSSYVIIGTKDDYAGMYANVVKEGDNKTTIIYPVSATNGHENQIPVIGRILNTKGEILTQSTVVVTDKSTGEKIAIQFKDGLFDFYGTRGKEYTVAAEDQNYQSASIQENVPAQATGIEKISVVLNDKPASTFTLAARVFKEVDQSPLSDASVSVINFVKPDLELHANAEGIAPFSLPVGTAFLAIGNKDGYTGVFAGVITDAKDKAPMIYPVPANNDAGKQLPITGLVFNENGVAMPDAYALAIDINTGHEIPVKNENGILYFFGERDKQYKVKVNANNYQTLEKNVMVSATEAGVPRVEFHLIPANTNMTAATVIALSNANVSKFYMATSESYSEIVEKDNSLYLQNEQEAKLLGKGSIAEFRKDPTSTLRQFGIAADGVLTIPNIYFEYDKAILRKADELELDKIKDVLQRYPLLNLYINSYADVRGEEAYNLNLSIKRSEAISAYFVNQQVDPKQVVINSYGESAPAVSCVECKEEDHQKNRRAEFSFSTTKKIFAMPMPKAEMPQKKNESKYVPKESYGELVGKYGSRQLEGLIFKIAVGAYRYNHSLTFDELKDLGTIERKVIDDIMYYYVTDFKTFKGAEDARSQVLTRGVKDAYIAIFYNEKKVSFSKFISLTE